MRRPRILIILVAVVIGLAIVTGALAMALLDDDDETDEERQSPITAASTPTPAPTATVAAGHHEGIPDDVWARLQDLPDKLRDEVVRQFDTQWIDLARVETIIDEYENRNQGVRVGTVLEATDSMLRLEVYTTGERAEVALNDETVLKRGHDDITPAELEPDELVMVVSRDGGATAFSVTAFGVGAP
jgi:hypothetical protein